MQLKANYCTLCQDLRIVTSYQKQKRQYLPWLYGNLTTPGMFKMSFLTE